jgi:hypothetical protein
MAARVGGAGVHRGERLARRPMGCITTLHEIESIDVEAKGDYGAEAVGAGCDGTCESPSHGV